MMKPTKIRRISLKAGLLLLVYTKENKAKNIVYNLPDTVSVMELSVI